jgi:hypothetical protein
LPPIRLKSDAEVAKQETPKSASFSQNLPDEPHLEDKPLLNVKTERASSEPPAVDKPPSPISPSQVTSPSIILPPVTDSPSTARPNVATFAKAAAESTETFNPAYEKAPVSPSSLLQPRVESPQPMLTISPPPESSGTPVSGDILLPLIIFSVVKANPPRLVSELLFVQRYRNQGVGGEESYCLVNLMAVAEFLENVDLSALGLGDSEKKLLSTADLTPIPLAGTALGSPPPAAPGLRGRMEQQVDLLTGSANKVLSGVVDSSFGVLRSFLPSTDAAATQASATSTEELQSAAPWNAMRPSFGLLRRETGFSIANLAASLPVTGRDRSRSVHKAPDENGQQMVEVSSRPGSRASRRSIYAGSEDESEEANETGEGEEESEGDEESGDEQDERRSIRSFESMMSSRKRAIGRKSLSDRLASMPGLGRLTQSGTHETLKVRSCYLRVPNFVNMTFHRRHHLHPVGHRF